MDTDSLIVYIKAHYLYQDIAENIETCFDTSNYELDKPLPKGKNKKVIGLIKDKLGGEITTKFAGLRTKTYSSLIDDSSEDKKSNSTKRSVIKRKLKFQNYKNFLEGTHLDTEIKHLQKKKKIDIDGLKKDHKKFTKRNKLILKQSKDLKVKGIIFY